MPQTRSGLKYFKKGSPEAKAHMAKLRKLAAAKREKKHVVGYSGDTQQKVRMTPTAFRRFVAGVKKTRRNPVDYQDVLSAAQKVGYSVQDAARVATEFKRTGQIPSMIAAQLRYFGRRNPLTRSEASEISSRSTKALKTATSFGKKNNYREEAFHLGRAQEASDIARVFGRRRNPRKLIKMSWDQWDAKFEPEMVGESYRWIDAPNARLIAANKQRRAWTQLDVDGKIYIVEGVHTVNWMAYIITRKPYPAGATFEIEDKGMNAMGNPRRARNPIPMANPQKLLTAADRKKLPGINGQEAKGMEAIAFVKFFTPWTNWTWYATEFDGVDRFFGLVHGIENELGYFSLSELQSIRGPGGLHIERDMYWRPKKLSEIQGGVMNNPQRAGKQARSFKWVICKECGADTIAGRPCDTCSSDQGSSTCNACSGPLVPLGQRGRTMYFRCRNCGLDQFGAGRTPRRNPIPALNNPLVRGDKLPHNLREQVLRAFIYRWTSDNRMRESAWARVSSKPTIPLISDEQWLREHSFYVTKKGTLDERKRYAEPCLGSEDIGYGRSNPRRRKSCCPPKAHQAGRVARNNPVLQTVLLAGANPGRRRRHNPADADEKTPKSLQRAFGATANPPSKVPWKVGQKIPVAEARKVVAASGDAEWLRQFDAAYKLQCTANRPPKFVIWGVVPIGSEKKLDAVTAMVHYGDSDETYYDPPKGSKKGRHLYRHKWGEGTGKKKAVPLIVSPNGKALVHVLGPGQTAGDWLRG